MIAGDWGALVLNLVDVVCQAMVSPGPLKPSWRDGRNALLVKFNDPDGGGDRDIDRKVLPR